MGGGGGDDAREGKEKQHELRRHPRLKNKPAAVKPHAGAKFIQEECVSRRQRMREGKRRAVWQF